ncbi:hypothetical protein [Sporolactobacillus nakayamae]|uniref:Uncharacterized protein n=1 Tax=Sporolactobacillus nakayamae TaxID=269670 RepID=A0A1I2UNC0_9BACL|nr:hypothetical protein [Sporolactobacillus nakayamae]SFG78652.1 hypothetical protein SAMN02982927_02759 [Sporolactobacillus nakayamae]
MLAKLSSESKQEIISKLQSDNKQLDLQILAIKNELCRIHVHYEEDMKRLQTIQEHIDLFDNAEEYI